MHDARTVHDTEPVVAEGSTVSYPETTPDVEREQRPLFHVPARHNPKLQRLVDAINADVSLHHIWRCANVNAVDRSNMSDHGPVHIRIVAHIALELVRLLTTRAVQPPGVRTAALAA